MGEAFSLGSVGSSRMMNSFIGSYCYHPWILKRSLFLYGERFVFPSARVMALRLHLRLSTTSTPLNTWIIFIISSLLYSFCFRSSLYFNSLLRSMFTTICFWILDPFLRNYFRGKSTLSTRANCWLRVVEVCHLLGLYWVFSLPK